MTMTIRDILGTGGLKDYRLIAGREGLTNKIRTATVLEVTNIKGQNWLSEGQLYITSLYSAVGNIPVQTKIFESLISSGASGIVICHIGSYLKELDQRLIDLANKHKFPVIIARSDATYVEILNPIILNLTDGHRLQNADMQNKLIDYVLHKKDLRTIYRTMEEYYGSPIYFFDFESKIIYPDTVNPEILDKIRAHLSQISNIKSNFKDRIKTGSDNIMIKPVSSEGIYFGSIAAHIPSEKAASAETVIENFGKIFALVQTKSGRIEELERRKNEQYLNDLITWNFREDSVAVSAGLALEWDIERIGRLIIVNINKYQESLTPNFAEFEKHIENTEYKKIQKLVLADSPQNMIGIRSDQIIILLFNRKNSAERSEILAENIIKGWDINISGSVSVGISGQIEKCQDIPAAYASAMNCVRFARRFLGSNIYFKSEDLGIYNFLDIRLKDPATEKALCTVARPVLDYDRENATNLFETAKHLILNNINVKTTAEKMFLHRNTVLYRKNKIEEILGYSPWEMPYLLNWIVLSY